MFVPIEEVLNGEYDPKQAEQEKRAYREEQPMDWPVVPIMPPPTRPAPPPPPDHHLYIREYYTQTPHIAQQQPLLADSMQHVFMG